MPRLLRLCELGRSTRPAVSVLCLGQSRGTTAAEVAGRGRQDSPAVKRGDPERIYLAQRAGFIERAVSRGEATRERAEAVVDALEAECSALELERGSPEFWREAERRTRAST